MVQAKGVCVAPEKTATNPIAASKEIGKGIKMDKALPKAAPIKNKGVTSPPLNPVPKIKVVASIFKRKTSPPWAIVKDSTIVGIPRPKY